MRFLMLFALALATCQPTAPTPEGMPAEERVEASEEGVMLATDRQSYSPGQELRLTLRNEAQYPVGFNLCFSTLERREGEQWVPRPADPGEACPAILHVMLSPGTASHPFRLDRNLPAGEYRFRTDLENMDTGIRTTHVSNTFQVGS